MYPQSSPTMADIHNNTPTKRSFSSSGSDGACRRLVNAADTYGNQEEEEMSAVKKMRHQSDEATDMVNELFSPQPIQSRGPLGLNLTKSPSFLELIQKNLVLAAKVKRTQVAENVPSYGVIRSTATEGMKPSHFQASLLRIGDWEWKSRQQGDLVAKFYFAKSKLAWEILHEGLKSKIEMKCSDICALRISSPKDLPATLDIMVSVAPQFFRETNPLPYKSTRWIYTTDFTGGQARILRHTLRCDPGIMDKHIENLLSVDPRLYALSQANNINPESPFLGTFCSVPEMPLSSSHRNSYGNDDNLFGTEETGESFPLHPMQMEKPPVGLNHSGALQGVPSPRTDETSRGTEQLKSDKFSWKKFFETTGLPQKSSVSYANNLVNSESSYSRSNYSSPPEVIRSFPSDNTKNRQVESHSQSSRAEHAVISPCSEEPAEQRAPLQKGMFNWKSLFQIPCQTQPASVPNMNNDSGNGSQTLPQTNSQDLNGSQTLPQNPPSNDNVSPDRMALEGISRNLLSDDEVVSAVEKETLLSTVNSFSSLIGQASAPLSQSSHSQASNIVAPPPPDVEPTQVINSDTSESSASGADDPSLPGMESPSLSWELSPEDMASFFELLP